MTRYNKCLLWLLLGPVGSVCLGYSMLILFGIMLGPGFDMDSKATPAQEMFGSIASPAFWIVTVVGILHSFREAYLTLRDG